MVFSSLTFLCVFLPVTLLLYFIVPKRFRNLVLLVVSLVFYAWGEPVYVLLMIFSIGINYLMGIEMEKYPERAKGTFIYTVVLNLFILGFFKYYGFVLENINALFHINIPIKELPLPIGISFYTFQALSYIIDLYWKRIPCQKSLVRFAAYITMFPQLIAGPIVRYQDVEKELEKRRVTAAGFGRGCQSFLMGLAKKVLLANSIGALYETIHGLGGDISCATAWLGAIAYTLQIYFDFSGYSDMAIGLGRMFGFTFPKNFDYPYISSSVTEFWRRWHISLGTWFREYVYIPLGGNRVSAVKHIRNILIVWFLTGLWHGASWNFILWGLYYGVLLLWEKYAWSRVKCPRFINRVFTLLAVIVGWVIFSSGSLGEIMMTLRAMFGIKTVIWDQAASYYLQTNWVLLLAGIIFSVPLMEKIRVRLLYSHRKVLTVFCALLFIACIASLVTQNYNPFLYFRF